LDILFDGEANEDLLDDTLDAFWMHDGNPFETDCRPRSPSDTSDSSTSAMSTASTGTNIDMQLQASKSKTTNLAPLPLEAPPPMRLDVYKKAHEHWFVRVILLLVGFLHTNHHLSFRACGLLLWSIRTVFILMAVISSDDPMPTTLGTTFTHLGLEDRFTLLVICPNCRSVCGPPLPSPRLEDQGRCRGCNTILYAGVLESYYEKDIATRSHFKNAPKPKVVVPSSSISQLLAEFLARPGMEDQIDAWRSLTPKPNTYSGIWDGALWKEIRGADGELFFGPRDDDELRIAGTCALDW
jgi:hypothetical protein